MDEVITMKTFLTGRPGSGKSTVLLKVIERLKAEGFNIGGIITPEVRVKGVGQVSKLLTYHQAGRESWRA